jgi:hypothetical protein
MDGRRCGDFVRALTRSQALARAAGGDETTGGLFVLKRRVKTRVSFEPETQAGGCKKKQRAKGKKSLREDRGSPQVVAHQVWR